MSDTFWIAFFANMPATIAAVASAIAALASLWKLSTVHKQINSRMDQLLVVTATSSRAEGVKEESDRAKAV